MTRLPTKCGPACRRRLHEKVKRMRELQQRKKAKAKTKSGKVHKKKVAPPKKHAKRPTKRPTTKAAARRKAHEHRVSKVKVSGKGDKKKVNIKVDKYLHKPTAKPRARPTARTLSPKPGPLAIFFSASFIVALASSAELWPLMASPWIVSCRNSLAR